MTVTTPITTPSPALPEEIDAAISFYTKAVLRRRIAFENGSPLYTQRWDEEEAARDALRAAIARQAVAVPEELRQYVADALEHAKNRHDQVSRIGSQEWWRGHRDAMSEILAKMDQLNRLSTQPPRSSEPAPQPGRKRTLQGAWEENEARLNATPSPRQDDDEPALACVDPIGCTAPCHDDDGVSYCDVCGSFEGCRIRGKTPSMRAMDATSAPRQDDAPRTDIGDMLKPWALVDAAIRSVDEDPSYDAPRQDEVPAGVTDEMVHAALRAGDWPHVEKFILRMRLSIEAALAQVKP